MNQKQLLMNRRVESNDMRLELVETKPDPIADAAKNTIGIETTLLDLDDGAFARLTSSKRRWALPESVSCSGAAGGGCAPILAKWYEMFCPAYGQA